jgi:DNA-binding LytR/AlgR family response regulator
MMERSHKYSCIIIDDEPIAIRVINTYISKIDEVEAIGSFTNAFDAMNLLHNKKTDLIFLDINMPGINGIEFLRSIHNPPEVIFTTAFREYAAEAFDVNALDYLVKPVSMERFLKSINKFLEKKNSAQRSDVNLNENDYIILKSDKKNFKVKVNEILYIESLDDYVKVHTLNNRLVCYMRLSALESLFASSGTMIRIHRSYIINTDFVQVFTGYDVEINGKKIPIGRNYRARTLKLLRQED